MTVAPEVDGVVGPGGVVDALAAAGAVPSFGHTDASAEVVDAAVAAARAALAAPGTRSGRPTATHLFNGMRPLHHRDPGPVAACLAAAARGDLVVELVADGTHLADGTVRAVFDLVGPDAIALVTDAMAAAGMADGTYDLGPMRVRVAGGVARLADGDAIAGGTAHLLDVVRRVVGAGVPLVAAVRSASRTPADVLGRPGLGALEVGRRADVVVVDGDLAPRAVLRAGAWVAGPDVA
jgi:N-acetylglucosamine-6-phosphate deacetylase